MAGGFDHEDASDFISKVDDVSRLIDGLVNNSLSADYVAKRTEELGLSGEDAQDVRALTATAASNGSANGAETASDAEVDNEDIKQKVRELQERRNRRLQARARYEEHVKKSADGENTKQSTDYDKWDLWTPSDEEDELFDNLRPDNDPGFKAMSKDIDERHKRMKHQRQLTERYRSSGNEQYKKRQYAEAMKTYLTGIELGERTNAAIHSNCAMAALKCNCFASAIEHCDKALHIIEFFHNNNYEDVDGDESRDKHITLRIKTYQRRATARMKLAHLVDAVRDFTKAVEISRLADGDSKHKETALLEKELADAQLALEEERREKKMPGTDADGNTSAARDESGSGRGGKGARLMELKRIEALVSRLRETSKDDMESTYADACVELCTAMSEERESAPDVRTCVRVCGGLETLGKLIIELGRGNDQHVGQRHDNNGESGNGSATDGLLPLPEQRRKSGNDACTHTSSRLFHALTTLRASCATKKNVDFIMAQPHLLGAVISIVARPGDDDVTSSTMHDSAVAASDLLFEISRSCANAVGDDGFRTRLVSALTSAKGAPLTSLISVLSRGGSDEVKKACLSTTLASNRLLSNILGALSILLENAGARNILHADREDTTRDDKRELIAELSTFFMVCTTLFFGSSANTATMCLLQMTLNCIGNSVLEPRPLKSVATNRPLMAAVSAMTSSLVRSARQERTWGFGGPVVVEALSFFVNVLNDETARDFVCGTSLSSSVGGTDSNGGGGLVQDFIDLSTGVVVTNHADHAGSSAASRASIIISKLARFKDSVKARLVDAQNGAGVNNLQGLIERGMKATAMKASTTMSLEKDDSVDEKSRAAAVEATALIDTIMRTLAVCTATNDHAEKAIALVSRGAGFEFIVKGLDPLFTDSIVGNSCLCVSHIAGNADAAERLVSAFPCASTDTQPEIEKKDVIELLVNVAYSRRGNAQRNAAIALAKLARIPRCLERARELHALEIIHNQFKNIAAAA